MQKYSVTQGTNLVSLAGVVAMVLAAFKVDIGSEEIQAFIGAALAIYGLVHNWINRYKQGDLTLAGFRKE